MISFLELKEYRGFKQYKLTGLARVNLIVGKNNSGKTSILEAVDLLASGGDVRNLSRIARQRGEVIYDLEERDSRRPVYAETRKYAYPDITHFFNGHEFEVDSRFVIQSNDELGRLEVFVMDAMESEEAQRKLLDETNSTRSNLGIVIRVDGERFYNQRAMPVVPVTEDGALLLDQALRYIRALKPKSEGGEVQFVTQDSLERAPMSEMWDKVITEGKESDVVAAMRILEPSLNSIAFLTGERSYRFEPRGGILVGFEGNQKRVPLGSYGEGMRRLLALSLSLARAQDGILLIDEIDTGLHYSIMGDMWLLVAEAARRYNIQVFVTTHSFDCVRGLDWLCRHHPELGQDVSLQKVEVDLAEAVALDAEQIKIAVEQDIEVR